MLDEKLLKEKTADIALIFDVMIDIHDWIAGDIAEELGDVNNEDFWESDKGGVINKWSTKSNKETLTNLINLFEESSKVSVLVDILEEEISNFEDIEEFKDTFAERFGELIPEQIEVLRVCIER